MQPVSPGAENTAFTRNDEYVYDRFPRSQNNVSRSWSDEHIPVNSHSREPIRPAPRASSFSAARSPQRPWNAYPPPPPVPPLPPTFLPGFQSPPLSHANIDFTFADPPRYPVLPQPWRSGSSSNLPSSSHGFTPPPLPHQVTDPLPPWPSINHRNNVTPSSNIVPPRPVVPHRPTASYGYVTNTPNIGDSRPSSHTLAQSFLNLDHPPTPPPVPLALLSRPVSAHGEVGFERSPTISLQATPSLPPLPPKTFTSPVMAPLPFPSREHILTPSGQVTIVSPPSDAQQIPDTSETKSPLSESQLPETMSLDSDLKRATTLSLQESHRKQPAVEPLGNEEDDELARALAGSLSFSAPLEQNAVHVRDYVNHLTIVTHRPVEQNNSQQHAQDPSGMSATPSRGRPSFLNLGGIDILSPEELEDHAAHGQIMQELEDEKVTRQLQNEEEKRLAAELREREREDEKRARIDAEFTRRLQEEEAMRLEAEKRERELQDEEWERLDAEIARKEAAEEEAREMIREAQEREDAEMARRMAATNDAGRAGVPREMMREAWERKDAEMARRMAETNGSGQPQGMPLAHDWNHISRAPGLPQYNDVLAASGRPSRPTPQTVQSTPQIFRGSPPPTRQARAASVFGSGPVRPAEQDDHARSATQNFGATEQRSDSRLRPEGFSSPSRDPSPRRNNSAKPSASPSRTSASPRPTVAPEVDVIEGDLLKGVSYGFKPPDMHSVPLQPCPAFPECISLSCGPSPPFHIMATSWRHLMRLLARLETRIQANIDAIAQSKVEYLLRVVVQVAKLPRSVNTWRTILHITLDLPIPRDVQNAWRYQNKDTTTLPYSYTLGVPTPYLVNDTGSQFYVIPLSAASPFPIVPISLPNLALYLQSAMRDSRARKVQNDPSNGMRRLAKMVAECYPEEVVNADQEGRKPSRGVGNLFKRVVGRGGDREASEVNEDVYDIITPFRVDQYTAS